MPKLMSAARLLAAMAALALVVGCAEQNGLDEPPVPLGDFALGYNIVVAKNMKMIPPSRKATPEEWETVLKDKIGQRFGHYDGGKLYHIAVSVDGYALAVPGIPVVLSPKSILVISVNIWDDAAGKKLTDKPKQMNVLESLSGATMLGSGLTRTRRQQMDNLATNAAKQIETWMVAHRAEWFGETAGDVLPDATDAGAGEMPGPEAGEAATDAGAKVLPDATSEAATDGMTNAPETTN